MLEATSSRERKGNPVNAASIGAICCSIVTALACVPSAAATYRPPDMSTFEQRVAGAACIFVGTVSRVDTIRTDPWTKVIRYHFGDVAFAKGGTEARRARFETIVSTPRPQGHTYKGRRVKIGPVPAYDPPASFDAGRRYFILADGASQEGRLVQVAQLRDIFRLAPDASGVMVVENTTTPERRLMEDVRAILHPPPPHPVPAIAH